MKIGLIGCGEIATHMHLPVIKATEGVEVGWILDVDHSRAESVAAQFAVGPIVTDIPQAQDDWDAVIITTPPHVRPAVSERAIRAGYHVLAEKPLANSVAECQAQIQIAERCGKQLAVSHQYRFWPARQRIFEWIDRNELGPVVSITMSQGKPYTWASQTGYTMLRDQVPGGVLINAGIHPLDTLLWWLGDPLQVEYRDDSIGGLESNYELSMDFADGVKGALVQSRTSNLKDEIRIRFRDGDVTLPTYSRNQFTVVRGGGETDVVVSDDEDPMRPAVDQLIDFRNAVVNQQKPKVDGTEAMRCIAVIEHCYRIKRTRVLPTKAPIPGMLW